MTSSNAPVRQFLKDHFRHFNAAVVVDAAEAYEELLASKGKMFMTLAGAMSTAELGRSLAEMIRQDKVHAISCTGANLEEDLFNLVAHEHYRRIPSYRDLTPTEEEKLLQSHLNRVTDTCIPEEEAMRRVERVVSKKWLEGYEKGKQKFPHEYLYDVLNEGLLRKEYQIDPKNSWLLAAAERNLPIFVPGWEDSTLGNFFAAKCLQDNLDPQTCMKSGVEYMMSLANWYTDTSAKSKIGFFQIGGGIAGDFPICVVPMLEQDMKRKTPLWSYFCQISDSTTSYGGYSGAIPNEKITWGKLAKETPKFVIESDATIVAPLIFAYLMNW